MGVNLTIGKKKYAVVEHEMKKILREAEELRLRFTVLIEKDADALIKWMEVLSLPKDNEAQRACAMQRWLPRQKRHDGPPRSHETLPSMRWRFTERGRQR